MKAISFDGNGSEYFKIWIVNALLIAVTLGIYYPWARVRTLRYFLANSILEGRNFEYHATGKQLFIGYLVAMILFVVASVVGQIVSPIKDFVLSGGFALVLPWIIWRGLQFKQRMTSFSNVRFSFENELREAYITYLLFPLVYSLLVGMWIAVISPQLFDYWPEYSVFPQGFHIPFSVKIGGLVVLLAYFAAHFKKRSFSYVVNGCRYGQGIFSTRVKTGVFLQIILRTIGLAILSVIGLFMLLAVLVSIRGLAERLLELQSNFQNAEVWQLINELISGVTGVGLLLSFIAVGMSLFAYFVARVRAYVYANTSLDEHITLTSTLGAREYAWVLISNLFLNVCSLGLAIPWTKVRRTRTLLENTYVDASTGFDHYLTQKQKEQSALADQIGDAFDVDVGIGF